MALKSEARIYTTPVGKLWSVTTMLGIIDKSGPLTYWAAKQAVLYIEQRLQTYCYADKGYRVSGDRLEEILTAAKKEFRNVKETAAKNGTEVHKLIEEWARQGYKGGEQVLSTSFPKPSNGQVLNSFNLFLEWAAEVQLKPLENERVVYHPNQEFAGTADMIAEGFFNKKWRKPRVYLLDTKTSKDFYETYGPQVSAYTEGYRNTPKTKYDIAGMGIIRVGVEDGKPEFRDYTEHHTINYARFLAAKEAYLLWKGRPE